MNKTSYRVIGFGHANYGFFNQFHFCSTFMAAMNDYQNLVADPEMDGAVVIEVQCDSWRVVEEFGDYPVSVVFTNAGTFKVEKAPELALV